MKELGEFNKYVTMTAGNVGTLDALNRGEIWMGPVWVDMFFTFMNEGKLDPKTRMILPEPGMPGQPMYFVIPKKAAHPEEAKKFVEFVTSPEFQAKEIVQRFNWYPGIDGTNLKGAIPQEIYDKIYRDVTPEDLSKKGRAFPLADYYTAILEVVREMGQVARRPPAISVRREPAFPPYLLLLVPAVLFMLLMYGYPFVSSFVRSFIGAEGS